MRWWCAWRTTGHSAQLLAVAVLHRPQQPAATAALLLMQRIVELRIPAAEGIRLLVGCIRMSSCWRRILRWRWILLLTWRWIGRRPWSGSRIRSLILGWCWRSVGRWTLGIAYFAFHVSVASSLSHTKQISKLQLQKNNLVRAKIFQHIPWNSGGDWLHTEIVYRSLMVTHPSTNRAWRWVTSLIETMRYRKTTNWCVYEAKLSKWKTAE